MLLSERLSDPEVRDFFPQGFFPEELEKGCELVRADKSINWLQRPFRSIPQPICWARNKARREWSMRYWRSLQRREERDAKWLENENKRRARMDAANKLHHSSAPWPSTLHEYNQKRPRIVPDVPMVHNRWCLNCGREFYLHLNGTRYTRLGREKLRQIVVAIHMQGYVKVDTGYYVLIRGRYERTLRFHDCTLNPMKVWIVSSARY